MINSVVTAQNVFPALAQHGLSLAGCHEYRGWAEGLWSDIRPRSCLTDVRECLDGLRSEVRPPCLQAARPYQASASVNGMRTWMRVPLPDALSTSHSPFNTRARSSILRMP